MKFFAILLFVLNLNTFSLELNASSKGMSSAFKNCVENNSDAKLHYTEVLGPRAIAYSLEGEEAILSLCSSALGLKRFHNNIVEFRESWGASNSIPIEFKNDLSLKTKIAFHSLKQCVENNFENATVYIENVYGKQTFKVNSTNLSEEELEACASVFSFEVTSNILHFPFL